MNCEIVRPLALTRRAGLEPATVGLEIRGAESVTDGESTACAPTAETLGVLLGVFLPKLAETDPELAAVVAAWPTLPDAIRAGIVAMVRASGRTGE
ncbi:MAG: hypothetical protein HOP29_12335 [Phycisphaerales bacterium]|nr:hypothetical protein [Phycisphaerales bacterium]